MDWRLRVPSAIYRLAMARAGSDRALADLAVRWLTRYAQGETQHQQAAQARARSLSPERRSEIARQAALARHHRDPSPE